MFWSFVAAGFVAPVQSGAGIVIAFLGVAAVLAVIGLVWQSVVVVQAHERAVLTVRGEFREVLEPGVSIVPPLVSGVHPYDVREQTLSLPAVTARTRDHKKVAVEATFYVRVGDVKTTFHAVEDYERSVEESARTVIQELVERSTWETLASRTETVADHLQEDLQGAVEEWGVDVEDVEVEGIELVERSVRQ